MGGRRWGRGGLLSMAAAVAAGFAQAEDTNMAGKAATESVVWVLDNTQSIGGVKIEVQGRPKVIDTEKGKAVLFNGETEAIFVDANPLKGAATFTLEALFRPDAEGAAEQRFVHVQESGADSRVLLETRLTGDSWYADTYINSPAGNWALADGKLTHPLGKWHTLALVYDGTNMYQYVDGKRELSHGLKFQALKDAKVSVGCRFNMIHWFKGAIREVRFTRSALTVEQLLRP